MAYGKYRHSTIKGQAGTDWYVEVWKKDNYNQVENGEFTTDLSDWYNPNSWTWVDNNGIGGVQTTGTGYIRQSLVVLTGTYYVNIDINSRTQGYIEVEVGGTTSSQITTNGVTSITLVASILGTVTITAGGSFDGVISNISVSTNADFKHSKELNLSGEGFEVKWTGEGGTRDKQFIASECVLNMFVENQDDEDWLYDDVFQKGDNYHYIRIYKDSVSDTNLWWYGWIQPGFDVIENAPFPY